ncbi:MAG: DUF488 domain-containing protein [Firmicutes bacterium]|nr:DUF488 domain-containing protein [Bacillota bacterium]
MRRLCTIGFAKKPLERFVSLLQDARVTRLVDIRLHNTSQLAGFAKKEDLEYIMRLVGIGYVHDVSLAPDEGLFEDYKHKRVDWKGFQTRYTGLLQERGVERRLDEILGDGVSCLLCSEEKAEQCHRGLLANYLRELRPGEIEVLHLR